MVTTMKTHPLANMTRHTIFPNANEQDDEQDDEQGDEKIVAITRRLAVLLVEGKHDYAVKCDALTYCRDSGRNNVMAVSFAGSGTACKAVMACLQSGKSTSAVLKLQCSDNPIGDYTILRPFPDGYEIRKQTLKLSPVVLHHCVMVAKESRLITDLNETAVWCALRSEHYTTPVLRPWAKWLMDKMLTGKCAGSTDRMLETLPGFQIKAAIMNLSTDDLDLLVTEGIKLTILRFDGTEKHHEGNGKQNGKAKKGKVV